MINTGIYTDLTNEEYHGHKDSISRTGLMDFSTSPYTYWAKHINPNRPPKKNTPAMAFGSAFHTLILEPDKFDNEYVMKPEPVLLKNGGRELYDNYKNIIAYLESSDKQVLDAKDWARLMLMKEKFMSNRAAVDLIKDARIENSFFWQDKESGLLLKCRPDILHDNIIVDLKTCDSASPREFQHSMVGYGNHIQGAMIRNAVDKLEGRRINNVINICIENKYPHNMGIYIIDEEALDEGENKYKQICLALKTAAEKDDWIDYGIETMGLPKWAY